MGSPWLEIWVEVENGEDEIRERPHGVLQAWARSFINVRVF